MAGQTELHLTAAANPMPGCVIHLDSTDAWLFLPNIRPSTVAASYLPQIRISGAVAVSDNNCRVVEYDIGTVVIPQAAAFKPLEVFSGPCFTGESLSLGQYVYYQGAQLGVLNAGISSFKLKRGYMATLAQSESGNGVSRNYVAQDGDLEVSVLPAELDNKARFVYVLPWRWVGKKGSCDASPSDLNANWWYNWNISENSTRDREYVAIRQQPYWPGLNQDWKARGINHLSGFNEPNNSVEDAYKNLSPPGSVDDAVARWPELLATGLRVGAPAVTDGGQGWITDFMNKADAAGMRVDYVPIHYYRCYGNNDDPAGAANQLYNFLKGIYDAVKRPLWVTEFNNGANWTGCADPSYAQNAAVIEAMIQMMDDTPWIERYAIYSRVEYTRQTHYDGGGLTPMGVMYRDHVAPLAYVQALPDNGTRSHAELRFDGESLDDSGYGNNGLVSSSPTYAEGPKGQALVFDGAHTKVTLPPNIANGSAFTFAAWINWQGGGNWQRIFDFGNSATQYMFLTPSSGSGTLRFAMKNGGSEQTVQTAALAQNQWQHVAVTLAGNTARLYVNGVQVAANSSLSITPANFSPRMNFLGDSQFVADPLFNGLMDDVLITDEALSPARIAALLTNTPPQFTDSFFTGEPANEGQSYSGSIAGTATDADAGDALAYTKAVGPAWLTVTENGALVGTPGQGDGGTNTFIVRVSDSAGEGDFAQLSIVVNSHPDLVARYAFDGNADATAGTADGIPSGGPTYTAGKAGLAINLDGADDMITLPAGVADSDDLTIAAWVNWDGGSNWQRIFDFGNGTSQYLFLTPSSSANTLRFAIKNGGSEQILQTSRLPVGQWVHVAVTLSGDLGRLYVNGAPVATSSMTLNPSGFKPSHNYLGKSQFNDPYFKGRIDEFLIYDYALSGAQIAALLTNQAPRFVVDPILRPSAPVSRWYTNSIAGLGTDADEGDALIYSKVAGPAWLHVAEDGSLSGTPGAAHAGLNSIRVRVSDPAPVSADATLKINVVGDADLVAQYEFEGNALDTAGAHHGSTAGAPVYVAGKNGKAIELNGVDDYVTLPAGVASLGQITLAAWVNWDGGSAWQRIFDFGNTTTRYFFLTPNSGGGTTRFAITVNGYSNEQRVETTSLTPGQWVHLAVTLSGGTGRLYLNGQLVDSGAVSLTPLNVVPVSNYIGRSQFSSDPLFAGRVDGFRIYRRALTDFEIAALAHPDLDSDGDGHLDSPETDADIDGDGTPNYLDLDSDGDGLPDSAETFGDWDEDGTPNIWDTDSDNDSIPDGWEVMYGLNPLDSSDGLTDLDQDGVSNAAEYVAGTLPNDRNDYFALKAVAGTAFSATVEGRAGRIYTLLRSTSLEDPVGDWNPVVSVGPLSSGATITLTDPTPLPGPAFYRAEVSMP